jgi:DNA-binding response OmpR family regulator
MRILIAEDEPAFRQFLEGMLADWGYEVVIARDGSEAWVLSRPKTLRGSPSSTG